MKSIKILTGIILLLLSYGSLAYGTCPICGSNVIQAPCTHGNFAVNLHKVSNPWYTVPTSTIDLALKYKQAYDHSDATHSGIFGVAYDSDRPDPSASSLSYDSGSRYASNLPAVSGTVVSSYGTASSVSSASSPIYSTVGSIYDTPSPFINPTIPSYGISNSIPRYATSSPYSTAEFTNHVDLTRGITNSVRDVTSSLSDNTAYDTVSPVSNHPNSAYNVGYGTNSGYFMGSLTSGTSSAYGVNTSPYDTTGSTYGVKGSNYVTSDPLYGTEGSAYGVTSSAAQVSNSGFGTASSASATETSNYGSVQLSPLYSTTASDKVNYKSTGFDIQQIPYDYKSEIQSNNAYKELSSISYMDYASSTTPRFESMRDVYQVDRNDPYSITSHITPNVGSNTDTIPAYISEIPCKCPSQLLPKTYPNHLTPFGLPYPDTSMYPVAEYPTQDISEYSRYMSSKNGATSNSIYSPPLPPLNQHTPTPEYPTPASPVYKTKAYGRPYTVPQTSPIPSSYSAPASQRTMNSPPASAAYLPPNGSAYSSPPLTYSTPASDVYSVPSQPSYLASSATPTPSYLIKTPMVDPPPNTAPYNAAVGSQYSYDNKDSKAHRSFMKTLSNNKSAPKERLPYGLRLEPVDSKTVKENVKIQKEKLTVEKPITELSTPTKFDMNKNYAEQESKVKVDKSHGTHTSYRDIGYRPIAPPVNMNRPHSRAISRIPPHAIYQRSNSNNISPSVPSPIPPLPGYKAGGVIVDDEQAKNQEEYVNVVRAGHIGYGYTDDLLKSDRKSKRKGCVCGCKGESSQRECSCSCEPDRKY